MKRPTNVHKFKFAMALIGVLLVGVIGYTLWFVNHSEKVANDAYAKSNNSYTVKPAKKVATISTQQYLTIKEWGVKMPISANISDATYVIKGETPDAAFVSLHRLDGTGCSASGGTLGVVDRFTKDEMDTGRGVTMLSEFPTATRAGNYYFIYHIPQAYCDPGKVQLSANVNYHEEFGQAVKQMQVTQYLTIKEWGVKVSIDDPALKDAIYKAPTVSREGVESVILATKDTASMDFVCGGEGSGISTTHRTGDDQDALLRAKTPAILSTGSNNSPSTFVRIGNYYYVYQHNTGHGACGITSNTLAAEARAASNAFAQSSIVGE